MMNHIILAAFGTTSRAIQTYSFMDSLIRPQFPDCELHWVYSSPSIREKLKSTKSTPANSLLELNNSIDLSAKDRVVIQSVHVTPGHEFHRVVNESKGFKAQAAIGLPLLSSPQDFRLVADCLSDLFSPDPDHANLVIGHGTDHPSWAIYPTFERILRDRYGENCFLAALEKFPDSSKIVENIVAGGFSRVKIIPFLMVAGMHFQRDILGEGPDSWKNRLTQSNLPFSLHEHGLGILPGVSEIFCNHIRHAFTKFDQS